MQKTNIKVTKIKVIITLLLVIAVATNCTTHKKRDRAVVDSLSLQNKTIDELMTNHQKQISNCTQNPSSTKGCSSEVITNGLKAIKKSNDAIISKLKVSKKECNCGKN